MPASAAHIAVVGKATLEYYLRNPPADQIKTGRPWIRKLRSMKDTFPGGKQHIVVQIRASYDSNAQWYYGEQEFEFNKRDSLEQAFFRWTSMRDGFTMTTDEFVENGLTISEDSRVTMTGAEKVQLTDLFKERTAILMEGFEQALDQGLLRAGGDNTENIKGLDWLIGKDADMGTVANIDRSLAANSWWRPNIATDLSSSTVLQQMELGFRACQRNGGMPDFIMMGSNALDVYRTACENAIGRRVHLPMGGGQPQMDGGTGSSVDGGVMTGLHFKGIPITWNPVFADLDVLEGSTTSTTRWERRIYMLNCMHLKMMCVRGFDEVPYTPPPVYNREAHFFARRWKGALIMKRANAHWLGITNA